MQVVGVETSWNRILKLKQKSPKQNKEVIKSLRVYLQVKQVSRGRDEENTGKEKSQKKTWRHEILQECVEEIAIGD